MLQKTALVGPEMEYTLPITKFSKLSGVYTCQSIALLPGRAQTSDSVVPRLFLHQACSMEKRERVNSNMSGVNGKGSIVHERRRSHTSMKGPR